MKRKFILLPIVLTTLTPMISMTGCNKPKSEYKDVQMFLSQDGLDYYSDLFFYEKDKKYHLYIKNLAQSVIDEDEGKTIYLRFWKGDDFNVWITPNAVIDNFLVNDETCQYEPSLGYVLLFDVEKSCDVDIYITFKQQYFGYFELF